MSWTITGWAKGSGRDGSERAVRVQVLRPDKDVMESDAMRAEATGLYRRTYGDWPEETGRSVSGSDGPGTTLADLEERAKRRADALHKGTRKKLLDAPPLHISDPK